jgi:hypothetical protein
VLRIHVGPSRDGIEAPEHVLIHVRFAFDEADRSFGALEKPQIAVARDIDEPFDGAAVAAVVTRMGGDTSSQSQESLG